VKLFLDTSVLLAACGSATGASREIFTRAHANAWELISTPYVLHEVHRNLEELPLSASTSWMMLKPALQFHDDIFTLDRPAIFQPSKDRPILFSALAWAEILLTLDEDDFGPLMRQPFYGLLVFRPGVFLESERAAHRLL
jgi:predicted nucleic acid-binding protein